MRIIENRSGRFIFAARGTTCPSAGHQTLDDHGHVFEFFWAALDDLPFDDCHPLFQGLCFLCERRREASHQLKRALGRRGQPRLSAFDPKQPFTKAFQLDAGILSHFGRF